MVDRFGCNKGYKDGLVCELPKGHGSLHEAHDKRNRLIKWPNFRGAVVTDADFLPTPNDGGMPCTYDGCPYPTNPRYDHDHPTQEVSDE